MFVNVAILCAVIAAVNANVILAAAPLVSTGISTSSRQQDDSGNYAFKYGITDRIGATNSRAEVGDSHGNKKGFYTIADIDGRARRVDYVADTLGFRASVKTNEPGTALSAPADVAVVSPYAAPGAVAKIVAPAASPIAARAPVASSSTVIRHATPAIAPVAYNSVIGHGILTSAPVAYSSVIGHRIVAPLGIRLAAPLRVGAHFAEVIHSVKVNP